jgi:hypothetical protein
LPIEIFGTNGFDSLVKSKRLLITAILAGLWVAGVLSTDGCFTVRASRMGNTVMVT